MCKISVIIPTYNYAKYLPDCLDSLVNQSIADFEIIVIDDASSDNTTEVIDRYRTTFGERLSYNRLEANVGRGGVRNYGVQIARGEYITFLDADDAYLPEKLERQAKHLDEHPEVGAVTCRYSYANEYLKDPIPNLGLSNSFEILLGENNSRFEDQTGVLMVRRNILKEAGLFDSRIIRGQDTDMIIRIARISKIDLINESLYLYRQHESNMRSITGLRERTKSNFIFLRKIIDGESDSNKERARQFAYARLARHVYRLREQRYFAPIWVWFYYSYKFRSDLPFASWLGLLGKTLVGYRLSQVIKGKVKCLSIKPKTGEGSS